MMELFTLGASDESGYPYSETDVREQARALTGWTADWVDDVGYANFRFDPERHDDGPKTIFGQTRRLRLVATPAASASSTTRAQELLRATSSGATSSRRRRRARPARRSSTSTSQRDHAIRPVLEAILMHPDFYRGPGDGEAAGRLHRRAAPRAAAAASTPTTGSGSPSSPASGCSGRRTSPAGTTRAGSTPRRFRGRWIAANEIAGYDVIDDDGPYDAGRDARRTRGAQGARFWGEPQLRAGAPRRASSATPARSRRVATADWQQEHVPRAAPERPAHADRHLPRHADLLRTDRWPATTATSSRARTCCARRPPRRAAACRAIEPGMPVPAGHRAQPALVPAALGRSRCSPSTAPRSCGSGDARGGDRPGGQGANEPRARLDLPRRRHRLALGARPDRRPDLPRAAAEPGSATGRRHRVRRGPAACAGTRPPQRSPTCTRAGKVTVLPAIGYDEPRPVALHLAPLLGGRRAAARTRSPAGWAACSTRSAPQTTRSRASRSTARSRRRSPPVGAGRGDRRARRYDLWAEGVWGEPESLMFGAVGELGRAPRRAKDVGARRGRDGGRAGDAAAHAARSRSRRGDHAARSPTRTARTAGSATASRRSRRCSAPACRSAARRSRRRATSTPTTTRPTASTTTSRSAAETLAAFQADLEARGLADRVITLVWSEFGRRPEENDSGTDHGAGGAAYVIGTRVQRPDGRRVPRPRPARRRRQPARDRPTSGRSTARSLEQWFGVDAGAVIPDAGSFARPALIG